MKTLSNAAYLMLATSQSRIPWY